MKITRKTIAAIGASIALALGFTACGGDEAEPAETSASETMAPDATDAPETTEAEPTEETPSGPASEGTGGMVDGGYITFEVPDGVTWEVNDSPYIGYAVARINVGSFPDLVGEFNASTTTMVDSMDSALDEMKNEMDAFGGGYEEPVQVTYGDHTYWQTTHPSRGIYLATFDEPSGLFVEHVIEPNDDGTGFAQEETMQVILDSIKYQMVETVG